MLNRTLTIGLTGASLVIGGAWYLLIHGEPAPDPDTPSATERTPTTQPERGAGEPPPRCAIARDRSFSKETYVNYTYGIAGFSFGITLRSTGTAGLRSAIHLRAAAGPGSPPFNTALATGEVLATSTSVANMQLTASARVDLGLARGGIDGTVDVLRDLNVPAEARVD